MSALSALKRTLHRRIDRLLWTDRPAERGWVELGQRRVYTLPNRAGMAFLAVLLLLFLTSTNYDLNLGLALTYLLTAWALISVLYGFRNLAWLCLAPGTADPVFSGQEARFTVRLRNPSAYARHALCCALYRSRRTPVMLSLPAHSEQLLTLSMPTRQRGWLAIPRLLLETVYPFGLLRVWSTWHPAQSVLVYPAPEDAAPPLPILPHTLGQDAGDGGQEDFSGVRAYAPGDTLRQLAWRQMARLPAELGGVLLSKQFAGGALSHIHLDWQATAALADTEARLSRMTAWVLDAETRHLPYAFTLGGVYYPEAQGPKQRDRCLRALALYGIPEEAHP